MGITRLKRKARRNKQTAAKRQNSIQQLNRKPVIKNIDKEAIKASFGAATPAVEEAPAPAPVEEVQAPVAEAAEPVAEEATEAVAEAQEETSAAVEEANDQVEEAMEAAQDAVEEAEEAPEAGEDEETKAE